MTRLSAFIEGVGLLGPGLNQWPHAAALLTCQAPYAPEDVQVQFADVVHVVQVIEARVDGLG
ncbi:hypothetical protein ACQCS2_25495, partial [Ralstonia pseudosolanacearum]